MKKCKIMGVALMIAMLMSLCVFAGEEPNLVPNSGMESDSAGEEWKTFAGTYVKDVTVTETATYDAAEFCEGERSLKLTGTGSKISAFQRLTLEAGVNYEVSAYIKADSMGDAKLKMKAIRMNPGDTAVFGTGGDFTSAQTGWKKISILIKIDPATNFWGEKSSLVFELTGTGTVYIDNVSVKKHTNIIFNGDCDGLSSEGTIANFSTDGAVLRQGIGFDGGKSLVVDATTATASLPYAYMDLQAPVAGAVLKVSFWAKTNGTIPPYIQWSAASKDTMSWSPALFTNPAAGVWTYFECNYTLPAGTTNFRIMFRTAKTKITEYDDIKISLQANEITFLKSGAKINTLQSGVITAKLTYVPVSGETVDSAVIIAALYKNEDGAEKLVAINTNSLTEAKTALFTLETSVTVPDTKDMKVKAFVWKSLSGMQPILNKDLQ